MNYKLTGIVVSICSAAFIIGYYIRSTQKVPDSSMQLVKLSDTSKSI